MISTFIKAVGSRVSLYFAELPYNLKWQIRPDPQLMAFLKESPITVLDIGARGGEIPELRSLKKGISYIGFDADKSEAQRLSQKNTEYHSFRVFPYFVGGKNINVNFHLYRNRGESSCQYPSPYYQSAFAGDGFVIEDTISVTTTALDDICETEKINSVDVFKLDVQGGELAVLEDAETILKTTSLIEVEVEFFPMYEGNPLFHDIAKFLHQRGYMLLFLNRVFIGRKSFKGPSRGQLIFGDALFGLRPEKVAELSAHQQAKYIVLLTQYGHLDYADELLHAHPNAAALIPTISRYCRHRWSSLMSLPGRVIGMQLDKFIAGLLLLRKTNQMRCDSDRSWPTN